MNSNTAILKTVACGESFKIAQLDELKTLANSTM